MPQLKSANSSNFFFSFSESSVLKISLTFSGLMPQISPRFSVMLCFSEPLFRAGMRWYSNIGRRVWCYEIWQWLFFDRRIRLGPTVGEFLKGGWRLERTNTSSNHLAENAQGKTPPAWSPRVEIL